MKKLIFFTLTFASFCIISCKKDTAVVDTVVVGNCDTVTYDKHIKTIVANNCLTGCHGGSISPTLNTYALLKSQISNGKLKSTVITNKSMPQGSSLTGTELGLFECWISNGGIEK